MITEFNVTQSYFIIYKDNVCCINIVKNAENSELTKHINIHYHYVKHKVQDETVKLKILTNPVKNETFLAHRNNLNII